MNARTYFHSFQTELVLRKICRIVVANFVIIEKINIKKTDEQKYSKIYQKTNEDKNEFSLKFFHISFAKGLAKEDFYEFVELCALEDTSLDIWRDDLGKTEF